MIDLKRSKLVIQTHDHQNDYRLNVYFIQKGLPVENIALAHCDGGVVEARNGTMKFKVLPEAQNYEWFIFADKDHFPKGNLADPFFDDVPFDVVGCTYDIGGNQRAWLSPDNFHMGLVRIRSEALMRLQPPWFMFTYNDDGTEVRKCECGYFRDKLLELGCTITRRGWIDHDSKHTWHGR